jgi:acyl-CoA thioester hydrolase
MSDPHVFPIRVYYEDTDHSGLVYHANYLKFMERAREHWLGIDVLLRMLREDGQGFVVYKAEIAYKEGAQFGDQLEVHTRGRCEGEYRLVLDQDVLRMGTKKVMVAGRLTLVCIDADRKLVPLPDFVRRLVGEPE